MGQAMGWTPADVRAASLADVVSAVSGFLQSKGVSVGTALTAEDVAELRAALEED